VAFVVWPGLTGLTGTMTASGAGGIGRNGFFVGMTAGFLGMPAKMRLLEWNGNSK
jgi:hypothetical protein